MKQKDRELLLKDLCARLPYELKGTVEVEVSTGEYSIESGHLLFMEKEIDVELLGINKDTEEIEVHSIDNNIDLSEYDYTIDDFKPYLRPMSSMTEEEKEQLAIIKSEDFQLVRQWIKNESFKETDVPCPVTCGEIDYLNSIHVDYRDLIPMDLAIEVTKENNPYKY